LHRADLLQVLAAGAAGAGVEINLGTAIDEVVLQATGTRLRDAAGAETAAEVVVAADGVRSGLRGAHFTGAPARFTGQVAWRGLVAAAGLPERLRAPVARVTMGPGRHLVTYPLRGGRLVNFVAVEERADWTAEGWMTPDDPENLRRAFAGWKDAEALLARVESCHLWGLFDHAPLARWVSGRLALLGDACHPMLPFLAQGATMALEDAWVLADALDQAPDPERGLAAYAAARLPRVTRIQRAAARSGRLYHLRPGARELAHAGLAAASALAPGLLAGRFYWLFGEDVTLA
jgi:salicylate hydroxylase